MKEEVMKKESFLALALLLLVVLGCEPSNNTNSRSGSRPGSSQGSNSGSDTGPVSESGPDRPDYGPTRNPAENAHDYRLRQQGQVGPCASAWDDYYASYFNWKNGRITEGQYRDPEQRYNGCVAQNYR
jgi:hypothetical protein